MKWIYFYPELYRNSELNINSFYSNYVTTYIDKDVSDIIEVKNKNKIIFILNSS